MTKEEIDQVKNWTSDEARQYFIDQEKEIERLIAGRTKSEERIEALNEENERMKKDIILALQDMVYKSQGAGMLMWGKNGGTQPHKSFLRLMELVKYDEFLNAFKTTD